MNVLALLKKKGKSMYWLYTQRGMSCENFRCMVNNQTKSIKFENIEVMCHLLDCTIDELITVDDN